MSPALIAALIQLGPAAYQMFQGIKQTREGKEMQKNLGERVGYEIPEAAQSALGIAKSVASPMEMAGQRNMQNAIALQQASTLGRATRAATSSQDLLGVMTNLGEKGMEQEQEIGMAAAQDYQRRQQMLAGAYNMMAGYQEKKRADEQQDWYEKAQAAAAMRGAGMTNTLGGIEGLSGVLSSFLKTKIPPPEPDPLTPLEQLKSGSISLTGQEDLAPGVLSSPVGYTPPAMTPDQMLDVTGLRSTDNLDPKVVSDQLRRQMFMNQKQAAMSKFRLEGAPSWTDQPFDPSNVENISFTQSVERPFSGGYENPVIYVPPMQSRPAPQLPINTQTGLMGRDISNYWSNYDRFRNVLYNNGIISY
jgi:hypothetical protein